MSTNAAQILKDPEIRKYFLSILQSNLSNDEKYERFIDFFALESQIKSQLLSVHSEQLLTLNTETIGSVVAAASQTIGIWKPEEILRETQDSIRRALQRLKHCQHRDGGWGFEVEQSHPWATAYAVLCLNEAQLENDFDLELTSNLEDGSKWLRERCDDWSVENIEREGSRSVYDVSIVIRACYESGETDFPSLDQALQKLWDSQNEDGGWDARLWPDRYLGPSRTYSEVGSTSTALQALAIVHGSTPTRLSNFNTKFHKALDWCIATQNDDGSWNNKSCTPTSVKIEGVPSVTKSCDGINGILTARTALQLGPSFAKDAVDKAVNWLLDQEKPLYDHHGNITGWGWEAEMIGDLTIADIQNTWLTLETLVRIESDRVSLPLMTANAQWLMKQQHKPGPGEDSIEDGKWEPRGHTARIALSLIEFYRKIKGSPLFATPDSNSQTRKAA